MTDQQLIYFTTIVELGSFSEAAFELHISQSSISKQIMQLEDELGVKLFDRSSRKARLSRAGEYLYPDAVSALQHIDHLKASAKEMATSDKTVLNILTLPVIGHYNFYIPIQMFEDEHKDYEISFDEIEEPDMYRRMSLLDFDAAITYFNPNHTVTDAVFYPLVEDEMVVVCPEDHRFCKEEFVTPQMLDDEPVLAMQKYTIISQLYELYLKKYGSNPHIIFRGRPGTILFGAEAKKGCALTTRVHTEPIKLSHVSQIPLDPPLKGTLGIMLNKQSKNKEIIGKLVTILSGYWGV